MAVIFEVPLVTGEFVFEWDEPVFEMVDDDSDRAYRASCVGAGYTIGALESHPCDEKLKPDGFELTEAQSGGTEFPDLPNDPRFSEAVSVSVTLFMGSLWPNPGWHIIVEPCTAITKRYGPFCAATIYGPGGAVVVNAEGVEQMQIWEYGQVVQKASGGDMGALFAPDRWPVFSYYFDSAHARNFYPQLWINVHATYETDPGPGPAPSLPEPPTELPPLPPCDDELVSSTITVGEPIAGVVPLG